MSKIGYDVLFGNCLETMNAIEDESIDTCITSPPYYGLRDYGTAEWEGGDPNCEHTISMDAKWNDPKRGKNVLRPEVAHRGGKSNACLKCGATRIDEQIGLEDTPEQFIENLVEVFRLVKRKLKPTGTLWLNIGDSYWSGKGRSDEIKPKDLIGIPWMLAFALRADGWYLRQDIIWSKPNCMPESVRDRCTKSHEYIFLLTKSKSYFYDYEAIKESTGDLKSKSNKKSVWHISFKPYKGAHFAVFPPDLIEPCIRAGSSEKGCCGECGSPYTRIRNDWQPSCECFGELVMEEVVIPAEMTPAQVAKTTWGVTTKGEYFGDNQKDYESSMAQPASDVKKRIIENKTKDRIKIMQIYKSDMPLDEHPVVPSVVLDPFGGSGTTAGVAIKNNRKVILCELNEDYIDLMEDRIASISNGWRPGQLTLGDF